MSWSTRILSLAAGLTVSSLLAPFAAGNNFSLTLIHSNDMESALLPNTANRYTSGGISYDIGGAAAFVSVAKRLGSNATTDGLLTLSAGDAWLPGLALDASRTRPNPVPWYDALAQRRVGFQAMTFGNHEFDLGPQGAKDFVNSYNATTNLPAGSTLADFPVSNAPFLTQIDLSTEPGYGGPDSILSRYAKSTVINTGGQQVGVIGLTTPLLPQISSPGNVTFPGGLTLSAAAAAVNAEAAALKAQGINKIVLSGHLQNIRNDVSLISLLNDVDIVVSAGGHEVMRQPTGSPFALNNGDSVNATLTDGSQITYGQLFTRADGKNTALVTAGALYRYVGNLVANFDANGDLLSVDNSRSGQARVIRQVSGSGTPLADVVVPDAPTLDHVETPVKQHIDAQNAIVLGVSETPLNGNRNPGLRTRETNLGNFAADALVWQVDQLVPTRSGPIVGLQNGGGLRFEGTVPAGNITRGDLTRTAPFFNLVSLIPDLTPAQLKAVLERGVSGLPAAAGQFGQFSGVKFLFDPARPAGDRVVEILLDTDGDDDLDLFYFLAGTVGTFTVPSITVDLATIDFLARGGDGYPLAALDFQNLGTTYQQAFENFLTAPTSVGGLGGVISSARYGIDLPPQRTIAVPEPTALGLLASAMPLALRRRRA